MVRQFCEYLSRTDPQCCVPERQRGTRSENARPRHIYTVTEIQRLMAAAGQLPPVHSLRPQTYRTLLARIIHDLQDGGGGAVWFLTRGIAARNSPFPWDVASLSWEERGETDVQQIGLRAHWQRYEPVKRASPTLQK